MNIGLLSNVLQCTSQNKEVEQDLMQVGNAVRRALEKKGHTVIFYDINSDTLAQILKDKQHRLDAVFNVCERYNDLSALEPNVASMLELYDIPYTGSSPWALAVCINKVRSKEILNHHGLPIARYQVFTSSRQKLAPELSFPLIVKPNMMDNSIGITKDSLVRTEEELARQVQSLLDAYDQEVLVEEFLPGREFTVGVLGNKDPKILPICEIRFDAIPDGEPPILGYDAKWFRKSQMYQGTPIICPADVPEELATQMKELAVKAYQLLGVRDYGRVDFRLDAAGSPVILEMNPNPGINEEDFIPVAADVAGISYDDLIASILHEALERHGVNLPDELLPPEDDPPSDAATSAVTNAPTDTLTDDGSVDDVATDVDNDRGYAVIDEDSSHSKPFPEDPYDP